jgi:hypothetical protein
VVQGLSPVLTSLGISSFVYFYAFNGLKAIMTKRAKSGRLSTAMNLLVASVAGVMYVHSTPARATRDRPSNLMITTPLWVANTRMRLAGSQPGEVCLVVLHRIVEVSRRCRPSR